MPSSIQTAERNRLVVDHLRNVKAAANRLKGSPALRDDLISAGYEAMVRAANRFDPSVKATFTTFSFRAVLGAMCDSLESHCKWAARHIAIDSDEVAASAPASPERQLLTTQVLAALESLPAMQRTLVKGHFLEEETLSSVAGRLGISKTKASVEIGRALQLLREKLDDSLAVWPIAKPVTRRRFSDEVRSTVTRRACEPGTNIGQLARELDIAPATIYTWLRDARESNAALPLAA